MPRYTRKKIEENPERQIALGMIVSEDYLKNVQSIYRPELIDTSFILTVNNWCLQYWEQFKTCPGVHIEDIYDQNVQNGDLSEEEEELIAELLDSLSSEYERSSKFNSPYLLDKAEKYFEKQNLKKKAGNIRVALSNNDLESAQRELSEYKTIARPTSKGIDPFTDKRTMLDSFEYASEPLFTLPGAAGDFLNDIFVPDSFVTLLGPEKKGKTWTLIELSIWARRAGCNVAFFSVGDMTLPQIMLRYGIRFCGKSNKEKFCREIELPCIDCKKNQDDTCDNRHRLGTDKVINDKGELLPFKDNEEHEPCSYCRKTPNPPEKWEGAYWTKIKEATIPLTGIEAVKKAEQLNRRWGKKSRFKLDAYAKGNLSIQKIENQLDIWEREEFFIPNVIIIDYMDNLSPDKIGNDFSPRHTIADIWGNTRRLSQERHCCLISASQSDALSYDAKWLTEKHFSESKTKNAHVTGMVTLNQTIEEKRRGIMRWGKLFTREDEFDSHNGVTILQSIKRGRPLLDSYY